MVVAARGSLSLLKFFGEAGLIVLSLLTFFALAMLPDILYLRFQNPGTTALMQERSGPILQTWRQLNQISGYLQQAVMTGEDLDFYHHQGIDFYELKQSMFKNWRQKRWARGASTITMQLAKNLYLSPRKTPGRKLLELVLALEMEQVLPKTRIMEIYLNVIEWGPHLYGAEAAARYYFKKSAAAFNPAEAAYLAAIIPNPRLYTSARYQRYADRRKRWILYRMGHPEREVAPPEEPVESFHELPLPEAPVEPEPEPLPPESTQPDEEGL